MNLRLFAPFVLISTLLAVDVPVSIYTLQAEGDLEKVKLQKRVVVEYKEFHVEADRAVYDKKNGIVRLYGDIYILDDSHYSTASGFALLDLKRGKIYASPFFFSEFQSQVWIAGSKIDAYKKRITLKNASISSCDTRCSDWRIFFQKGELDRQTHWVNLYHILFYVKDTPFLYFPYLGFSTLKQRHSGFLRPSAGISSNEGFIYIQPYYYAPKNWWDLEIDPQIRTKRGAGIYSTFRFVDSPSSYGQIHMGYFKEKKSYQQRKNLRHSQHYGMDLYYKRHRLLSEYGDKNFHDGLYVDTKSYNDVDYFNLQKSEEIQGISSIITSRVNYYYDMFGNYFGIYGKYFKDNRKTNNDDTLQILPILHYHKYLKPLFGKHFSYMIDAKMEHFYREKGLNALEYQIKMPIKFYYTFFNDSLGFSISEKLFANYADYNFVDKHLNKSWNNYHMYRNSHEISLYTDLVKRYDDFFHTLHLDASLNIPSFEKKGGDRAPFIDIEENSRRLDLSLQQYFYHSDGREFLYHRLLQPIKYEEYHKLKDLENEIGFNIDDRLIFNTDIFYSHQRSRISSVVTTLGYKDDEYDLFLSHFYKDRIKGEEDSDFVRFQGEKSLSKSYKLFATIDYDIKHRDSRSWSFGWQMKKRCWGYRIEFKREVVPLLSTTGTSAYENSALYFKIELYPIGGISQSIRKTVTQRVF